MTLDGLLTEIASLDGAVVQRPRPGDGSPEIAWGDAFAYYSPDGTVPAAQPHTTVVTKDYPDDVASRLGDGRWRVNVQVSRERFVELVAEEPRSLAAPRDFSAVDEVLPHPTYGAMSWVSVVLPGERTAELVRALVREAHEAARARTERRAAVGGEASS